jgi:hypothetical protein
VVNESEKLYCKNYRKIINNIEYFLEIKFRGGVARDRWCRAPAGLPRWQRRCALPDACVMRRGGRARVWTAPIRGRDAAHLPGQAPCCPSPARGALACAGDEDRSSHGAEVRAPAR